MSDPSPLTRTKSPATTSAARGFGFTFGLLATLLLVTLSAQIPLPSSIKPLRGEEPALAAIWPQGWSFFAAEPDADMYFTYRLTTDGRYIAVAPPLMSAADLWGLGRSAIVNYEQSNAMAHRIPATSWESCSDPLEESCVSRATSTHLVNDFSPATLCGSILFVHATLADMESGTHVPVRPAGVAFAEVTCAA